ncbi:proteasome assembly chaperone 4-like isoform X2 [Acropora palmata]|uniref:proteasome assembly chaperone 4-like isoform X2 n=1 Tax=Acropora palmata TaxID=6131 RepID=UPI003DA0BB3A
MAGNLSSISDGSGLEGCEMVECKFKVHTFSDTLLDQTVYFQVLRMKDSLYIWIGSSPELSSLAVAMCTRYDSVPSVANLLGSKADLNSSTLAQRLGSGGLLSTPCPFSINKTIRLEIFLFFHKPRRRKSNVL